MGASATALVAVVAEITTQISRLEVELAERLNSTRTPRSSAPCQDSG
jgi:hypothetical protein